LVCEVYNCEKSADQNDTPLPDTASRLALKHKVSPATVKRAAKFAEEINKLSPEKKAEVLAGKKKIIILFIKHEIFVVFYCVHTVYYYHEQEREQNEVSAYQD